MIKIRWEDLLVRLSELVSFSKSQGGRVVRVGVVSKAEPVGRNIRIISKDGEEFFFPNNDTFAFRLYNGEVLLKLLGKSKWSKVKKMWFQDIDSFTFQLKTPFPLPPEPSEEERLALIKWVMSRL